MVSRHSTTTRQTAQHVGEQGSIRFGRTIVTRTRIRNLSSMFFSAAVRVSLILARLVVEVVAVVEFSSSGSFLRFFFFFLDFFFLPPNDSPPFSFNLPAVTWSDMLWTVVVGRRGFWSRVCQGATKEIDSRVDEEGLAAMQQVCVVGYRNRRSS